MHVLEHGLFFKDCFLNLINESPTQTGEKNSKLIKGFSLSSIPCLKKTHKKNNIYSLEPVHFERLSIDHCRLCRLCSRCNQIWCNRPMHLIGLGINAPVYWLKSQHWTSNQEVASTRLSFPAKFIRGDFYENPAILRWSFMVLKRPSYLFGFYLLHCSEVS